MDEGLCFEGEVFSAEDGFKKSLGGGLSSAVVDCSLRARILLVGWRCSAGGLGILLVERLRKSAVSSGFLCCARVTRSSPLAPRQFCVGVSSCGAVSIFWK